jgi:rod shape-determining protein MreC
MQRLLNIIILFKEYFLLALLIGVSLILLGMNDNAQIRSIRSYTVGFVGAMQNVLSIIPNVVELKRENEILRQMNVNLSDEVSRLREARLENVRLRKLVGFKERREVALVPADVVGKSLHLMRNTITINTGEGDSVRVDMPIVSESGLVGRVVATSSHYAVGQLMFNKDFRASAKVQRSRVDGIIAWDGGETLKLTNVAKTQDVREGDLVITSEYSTLFPRDIRIGTVVRVAEKAGTLFREIDVAPSVDFFSLEQVFVVVATPNVERRELEERVRRSK